MRLLYVGTRNETSMFDVHHLLQQRDRQGMGHFLVYSVFMIVGLPIVFLVK